MTEVKLEKVTPENYGALFRLKVHPTQEHLVATNVESLAEAYVYDHARPFALYAEGSNALVGFVMLSVEDLHEGIVWVWRFMIGYGLQRQGYGMAAMRAIIEHIRSIPKATTIRLSHNPGEGGAGPFYRKLGFTYTGEVEHDEPVMELSV